MTTPRVYSNNQKAKNTEDLFIRVIRQRVTIPGVLWLFVLFVLLGLSVNPSLGLKGYFLDQKVIFDGGNYLNIARNGYTSWELTAFYPLWPIFLRALELLTGPSMLVLIGQGFAAGFFVLSALLFAATLKKSFSSGLTLFVSFLYIMNPNSFFHIMLYPESASALLIAFYMWCRDRDFPGFSKLKFLTIFALCALCALSRPWLPYFIAGSLGGWLIVAVLRKTIPSPISSPSFWAEPLPVVLGSLFGFGVYGLYTNWAFGSFFEAFTAQKAWGRAFGPHWSLLTSPKSVGGSDHVLFWDLQAFYLPWAIALLTSGLLSLESLGRLPSWIQGEKLTKIKINYLFWFCLIVVCGLSATAFLSYPIFMSIGRHVFSSPPIFFCIGTLLDCFRKPLWLRRSLCLYALVTAGFLVMWATRFSKGSWMG